MTLYKVEGKLVRARNWYEAQKKALGKVKYGRSEKEVLSKKEAEEIEKKISKRKKSSSKSSVKKKEYKYYYIKEGASPSGIHAIASMGEQKFLGKGWKQVSKEEYERFLQKIKEQSRKKKSVSSSKSSSVETKTYKPEKILTIREPTGEIYEIPYAKTERGTYIYQLPSGEVVELKRHSPREIHKRILGRTPDYATDVGEVNIEDYPEYRKAMEYIAIKKGKKVVVDTGTELKVMTKKEFEEYKKKHPKAKTIPKEQIVLEGSMMPSVGGKGYTLKAVIKEKPAPKKSEKASHPLPPAIAKKFKEMPSPTEGKLMSIEDAQKEIREIENRYHRMLAEQFILTKQTRSSPTIEKQKQKEFEEIKEAYYQTPTGRVERTINAALESAIITTGMMLVPEITVPVVALSGAAMGTSYAKTYLEGGGEAVQRRFYEEEPEIIGSLIGSTAVGVGFSGRMTAGRLFKGKFRSKLELPKEEIVETDWAGLVRGEEGTFYTRTESGETIRVRIRKIDKSRMAYLAEKLTRDEAGIGRWEKIDEGISRTNEIFKVNYKNIEKSVSREISLGGMEKPTISIGETRTQTRITPEKGGFGKGISREIQFTQGEKTPTRAISKFDYLKLPEEVPETKSYLHKPGMTLKDIETALRKIDMEKVLQKSEKAIKSTEKTLQKVDESIIKPVVSKKVAETIKPKIRTKSRVKMGSIIRKTSISAGLSLPAINTANIGRIGKVSPKRQTRIAPTIFPLQSHPFAGLENVMKHNLQEKMNQTIRERQIEVQTTLQNIRLTLSTQLKELTRERTAEKETTKLQTAQTFVSPRVRIPPKGSPKKPLIRIPRLLPPMPRIPRIVMPEGVESSINTTLKTIEHQMAKLKQLL